MREVTRPRRLTLAAEESQDEYNYRQSAERKRASSYDSQAFNLGGRVNWKQEINGVMSKGGGKGRYTRPLATYLQGGMLTY